MIESNGRQGKAMMGSKKKSEAWRTTQIAGEYYKSFHSHLTAWNLYKDERIPFCSINTCHQGMQRYGKPASRISDRPYSL
jgi:hypothetical protein